MFYLFAALSLGATFAALKWNKPWAALPIVLVACGLLLPIQWLDLTSYLLPFAFALGYRQLNGRWAGVCALAAIVSALVIAFGLLPKVDAIGPIATQKLSAISAEWSIKAGLNKTLIGLALLPMVDWHRIDLSRWQKQLPLLLLGPLFIAVIAWALGLAWDFKLSLFTGLFMIANLCFVVINEEIFFRGVVQRQLHRVLGESGKGAWLAVIVAGGIFGLLHFGGGSFYVILATLAGIVYGAAFWLTRSIWAGVWTHIAVNSLHFIFLQYPVPA
ncbi:CPBP family intramembrane glutamic endopeptidase [Simiduia agarivorans]|uniref:Abortive infection protein n=1 Tax=Simiduia agarivorans (strain DSM 21679 / JCM 13881 / BCRC 17597 / SA1) TaxID=1117647 RepID=K4KLY1_SIMAS|nr:CPBP family intramembrane glutamic endopeptidase [Simiduia agarivorans]AFU99220.1 Abortive infection protein [Simiduia agarivorans SA1 = DSM 21679]